MTELIKSPEEYLPAEQLKEISITLKEAKERAASLRVVDDASMDEANALAGTCRAKQKGIEAFRIAVVKPFKDHLANIDKFFKNLAAQFDEPRELIEDKVLKCRTKKAEAARNEQDRLDREAKEKEDKKKAELLKKADEAEAAGNPAKAEELRREAGVFKVEPKAPKKEAPAKSSFQEGVGRTTFVKDAEYRIENVDAIPDEYWIVDEKKIGKRVRELASTLEVGKVYRYRIPGVVITSIERPSYAGER